MKKSIRLIVLSVLLIALVASTFIFTGCETRTKIYVFNAGDYIAPELIEMFEEEYPQYEIVYDTFDSNEAMYQKLVSTNIPYDIIIPSDYMIERLSKEGRLNKIDYGRIPNIEYINQNLLEGATYDPDNEYSVPYMWGTLGLVYNPEIVAEIKGEDFVVDSWDVLWDPDFAGQILMLDSLRDAMCVAFGRLGYDISTTDPAEVSAAGDELLKMKKYVAQWGTDNIKAPMIQGHYALCLQYSGDAFYMICEAEENDVYLEYAVPAEQTTNIFTDAMVIPTTSKNTDGAYEFINFICDPEIAAINADYIGYSTPNTEALEILAEDEETQYYTDAYIALPPDDDMYGATSYFKDISDYQELYNNAWEKLRLSTDEEEETLSPLVYVYGGILVAVFVVWLIVHLRKKKLDKFKYEGLK